MSCRVFLSDLLLAQIRQKRFGSIIGISREEVSLELKMKRRVKRNNGIRIFCYWNE